MTNNRNIFRVNIRDRIKIQEIRKNCNVEKMIDDIQNYQLKWNQYVLRMPENSTAISTPRKKGFRRTLLSLERPVHVVAKLRMEEEEK